MGTNHCVRRDCFKDSNICSKQYVVLYWDVFKVKYIITFELVLKCISFVMYHCEYHFYRSIKCFCNWHGLFLIIGRHLLIYTNIKITNLPFYTLKGSRILLYPPIAHSSVHWQFVCAAPSFHRNYLKHATMNLHV